MRDLLIATSNKGKMPGMLKGLHDVPFNIISLSDIGPVGDVEEPCETFEGNAVVKAMTYALRTQKLTLADDSGLEIDALDGRPGVKSARYVAGTDVDRYQKVLGELDGVADEQRTGRYACSIAICDPEKNYAIRTFKGFCQGWILKEPRGNGGFGYDPIFLINGLGKTFAEASLDEIAKISHRAMALRFARETLLKEFV